MLEMLQFGFMQRAFAAGILVALLTGFLGVFVVQRRLSFLTTGMAHSAFGGVALGIYLSVEPLYVALPFTMLVAVGIKWVQERGAISADTAIGIFFSVSMALGVVFLAWTDRFATDAFSFLFGSILAVSTADLVIAGLLCVVTAVFWPFWGKWAYATFDRELARADGLRANRDDYILLLLLAVVLVVAIKIVGIVLLGAFAVVPAAAARLISGRLAMMTVLSMVFGVVTAVGGLFVSVQLDIPSGPAIIILQAVVFFALLLLRRQ